jgi:hypothetical protein
MASPRWSAREVVSNRDDDLGGPVGSWLRVTGIAPDEERIAAAIGNSNKEDFVQKEMCRRLWVGYGEDGDVDDLVMVCTR